MKQLGPFLARKNQNKELFWYSLTLGGDKNRSVWSIQQAPFDQQATYLPGTTTFSELPITPLLTLHAFDPVSNHYYSLRVTTERNLLRFRPIDPPLNMKPFIAEAYNGQGWTPRNPAERASDDIAIHGYPEVMPQ